MFELSSTIQKKNADAVAVLYERYGRKLYGYSISKWKVTEDDAWELIYKTLYKAISVSDQYVFEDEKKFMSFLFKIFINYLRNHYRDSKRRQVDTVELEEMHGKIKADAEENSPETDAISPQMRCLQKVLEMLQDWQRIVLLMRAQEFSYEEIGNYVHKPATQLKVYHMRLKKQVTDNTNECVDKNKR